MERLGSIETAALFLALGILLAAARLFGEIARRLNYPSVLGEILAGILLGPTLLGSVAPHLSAVLFPSRGGHALVFQSFMTLAIALFLLVAGKVGLRWTARRSPIDTRVMLFRNTCSLP